MQMGVILSFGTGARCKSWEIKNLVNLQNQDPHLLKEKWKKTTKLFRRYDKCY